MIDWLSAACTNSTQAIYISLYTLHITFQISFIFFFFRFSIAPINIQINPFDTFGNRSGIIDLLRIGVSIIVAVAFPDYMLSNHIFITRTGI